MVRLIDTPSPEQVAMALRALARDMGDPYRMEDDLLARSLGSCARAVLAEAAGQTVGVALFSPFVSTTRGRIGAFVTDLWVDGSQRGGGLGRALLARVRDLVAADWGGSFLRLNHYADNSGAAAFYARLGFHGKPDEIWLTLEGRELAAL
ncbi:MAG: GNAT family N-acetyltransferase [Paracoccaceae bacterium]